MAVSIAQCQTIPMADHQVAFCIGEREVLRWNFGSAYPRPFFFPLLSPSGALLTRMGHPGAPDHDHHQSLWFAHNKVLGIDFWANTSEAFIRQLQWFAMEDGDEFCRLAVELGWFDGHNPQPLIRQELICEVRPLDRENEYTLELQSRFIPMAGSLEFGRTNFGFLAVRVARSLSAVFGTGVLTGSEGTQTEKVLFGQAARWMDYSGQTRKGQAAVEGITLLDHAGNPGQPTGWHVRDDGWMCASPCMNRELVTTQETPLLLRYLLHVHAGPVDRMRADSMQEEFSSRPEMRVVKSTVPHIRWKIER